MSISSIPNIIAETLLAVRRSMTASVASVSIAIIDPSTVGTRFSRRLGTACKHSLDTSEKDPMRFTSCSDAFSEHNSTSRQECAIVRYVSHLLLDQASILAAIAAGVARKRWSLYRGIEC